MKPLSEMTERKFICAVCKEEFITFTTRGAMLEEMAQNFGQIPEEEQLTCCDDCYELALKVANA